MDRNSIDQSIMAESINIFIWFIELLISLVISKEAVRLSIASVIVINPNWTECPSEETQKQTSC